MHRPSARLLAAATALPSAQVRYEPSVHTVIMRIDVGIEVGISSRVARSKFVCEPTCLCNCLRETSGRPTILCVLLQLMLLCSNRQLTAPAVGIPLLHSQCLMASFELLPCDAPPTVRCIFSTCQHRFDAAITSLKSG